LLTKKKGENRYYIKSKPETQEHSQRLLEWYQILNAINASQDYGDYVFLENRKSAGLDHFSGLFYAIKSKKVVRFTHYKYWDETVTQRSVHPLALKESQGRWYLIAVDTKDSKLKTFGLDRMSDLDISKTLFRNNYHYDLKDLFTYSFGILNDENEKPQRVLLAFNYEQGQYIKTYPLHHTQKLLSENNEEIRIELFIKLSYDFEMDLLSYGEEVKVISPVALRKQCKNIIKML
jgi:proteasome accessory factor B